MRSGPALFSAIRPNQGASDDDAIGQRCDCRSLFRGRDPEPHCDGKGGHAAEPLHIGPDVVRLGDGRPVTPVTEM